MAEKSTILLVDDEREIITGLSLRLRAAGYEVRAANRALHGLELAKELHPDLIITDLQMPEIDGMELIRRLKADPQCNDIPVIVLSAGLVTNVRTAVLALGANQVLDKPYQADKLLNSIRSELSRTQILNPQATN